MRHFKGQVFFSLYCSYGFPKPTLAGKQIDRFTTEKRDRKFSLCHASSGDAISRGILSREQSPR